MRLFCLGRVRTLLLLGALLAAPLFSGCPAPGDRPDVAEVEETRYRDAKNLQRQGRYAQALTEYLKVIDARELAPESHLEAGQLYLKHMGDPVYAIYHFRKYLEQNADSPQAEQVRQLIQTAEKEFARGFPARPFNDQIERQDLLELVDQLRQENQNLREQLAMANTRLGQLQTAPRQRELEPAEGFYNNPQTTPQQPQAQPRQPPATTRTHVVQPGDTLSSISRQYYGTPSRWEDIFAANRGVIPNANSLRVGTELRLPE